VLKLSILF